MGSDRRTRRAALEGRISDVATGSAGEDLADLAHRVRHSFPGRCAVRFIEMAGIDRSMVLASQAFTSLIPLLILVATWAPASEGDVVGDTLVSKFGLEGDAASAVQQLFHVPEAASSQVSAFSAFLLVISGTSFTRRFQRMYRAAYGQEKAGVRSGVYSTLGLFVLLAEVFVLYGARALVQFLPLTWLFTLPITILTGTLLWTSIPYLLLNRQVHWRRLVAGGVLAAVATAAYSLATTIYMPDLIERYTEEFGLFGVTIALIGWLLVVAFILVGTASIASEFDASLSPWAVAMKARFRLEDPALERREPSAEELAAGLSGDDIRLAIRVLASWGILAAAVWAATVVVPGIAVPGGFGTYVTVSLALGLVSALLGALPRLLPVPHSLFVIAGLSLVVNGLLLSVVAWISPGLDVAGFGDAVLGATVIAVVTGVLEVVWRPIKQHL